MIFVKIPSISKFQWHSFSITSSSSVDEHTMSVIIKSQGSWTSSLHDLINDELESDSDRMKSIPIAVEGPYGPASTDFLRCFNITFHVVDLVFVICRIHLHIYIFCRYDSLLLIAGGIGITPFLSILQEIAAPRNSGNNFPTRIQLVYVVKKSQDVCVLNLVSPLILNQSAEQLHLKLKVFVTQEQQSGATLGELLNEYSQVETVQFSRDGTSYAIKGLESFLSMAGIAALASIVFLVFLICFSHIFLPDQKKSPKASKEKYSSSVSDLIIILSFVIAMICSSLVAIVVRWRRLKREPSQIVEKQVKSWQPSSIEAGGDLDKHEIHFTGRPNFQGIFTYIHTYMYITSFCFNKKISCVFNMFDLN